MIELGHYGCFVLRLTTEMTIIFNVNYLPKKTMSQITEDTSCYKLLIISLELSPLNYIGPGLSSFMHILLYIVRSVHVLQ